MKCIDGRTEKNKDFNAFLKTIEDSSFGRGMTAFVLIEYDSWKIEWISVEEGGNPS